MFEDTLSSWLSTQVLNNFCGIYCEIINYAFIAAGDFNQKKVVVVPQTPERGKGSLWYVPPKTTSRAPYLCQGALRRGGWGTWTGWCWRRRSAWTSTSPQDCSHSKNTFILSCIAQKKCTEERQSKLENRFAPKNQFACIGTAKLLFQNPEIIWWIILLPLPRVSLIIEMARFNKWNIDILG